MKKHPLKFIVLAGLALASAPAVSADGASSWQIITRAHCLETTYDHALLEALIKSDVDKVEELVTSGEYDVNDVICTYPEKTKRFFGANARSVCLASLRWCQMTDFILDGNPVRFDGYGKNSEFFEPSTPDFHLFGTPLMVAAQVGSVEVTRLLLKHGADPNLAVKIGTYASPTLNTEGYQYLTAAAAVAYRAGSAARRDSATRRILALLKAAGAKPGPRDGRGRTCLLTAVQNRSIPLFEFCVEAGLDPNDDDYAGKTVFDYCQEASENPYDSVHARQWLRFLRVIASYRHGKGEDDSDEDDF